jgi:hypothetical protein
MQNAWRLKQNAKLNTQNFNKADMKKSNKILLTYFLLGLFAVTAVHVTLYAKYKRGDYVPFDKAEDKRMEVIALPNIKYVSVTGLQRCNIFPATEPKMKRFRMPGSRMKYTIIKDTLIITADSGLTQQDMFDGRRGHQTVNLYLPGTPTINVIYSDLILIGAPDSTSAQSYVINLSNLSVLSAGDWGLKKGFLKELQVNANGSFATFYYQTVIKELKLQAENHAKITNENADIKHLQLQTDDESTITLKGSNVKDLQVVKE